MTRDARLSRRGVIVHSSGASTGASTDQVHPEAIGAWTDWLAANHRRGKGVWLVSWKKYTGRPALTYDEAVTEALRYGWVDSKPRKLDAERTMLWFAPRRRGSGWSRPNKLRIDRLEDEERLAAAGRQVVERAKADGSWTLLDAVEDLVVPDDLDAAFGRFAGAREEWDRFPRSARRGILEWIVQARRPATRTKRVEHTAALAARGQRANQWERQ